MKLYCGTYKKYNEGSLFGKWMDLDDYDDVDSFYEACKELHKDEEDPELMFQDVDYEHEWENGLYSECSAPADYWDIKEALEDSYIDDDIFDAFCSYECEKPSVELVKKCKEKFCGKYDSGEDYAQELFEECHSAEELKGLEWILRYVDWGSVWRDMSFDGYHEENGYIFDDNR